MKNKLIVTGISISILLGLGLIGISIDRLLDKNCIFVLTALGIGLLIIAKYLETIRQDE